MRIAIAVRTGSVLHVLNEARDRVLDARDVAATVMSGVKPHELGEQGGKLLTFSSVEIREGGVEEAGYRFLGVGEQAAASWSVPTLTQPVSAVRS
ncbi:hypothetical protein ACH4ND_32355 [Streptomyces sp. NPDC017179]|uniref:hypothetical protein n=1 Tax=Streptomyces sp. NPDC017179 TaxID=3364979 RepID=UPI0037AD641C